MPRHSHTKHRVHIIAWYGYFDSGFSFKENEQARIFRPESDEIGQSSQPMRVSRVPLLNIFRFFTASYCLIRPKIFCIWNVDTWHKMPYTQCPNRVRANKRHILKQSRTRKLHNLNWNCPKPSEYAVAAAAAHTDDIHFYVYIKIAPWFHKIRALLYRFES